MLIPIIGATIGFFLLAIGISAFVRLKFLQIASNYWDKKKLKNGNSYSPLRKKILGFLYVLAGIFIILTSLGILLVHLDDEKKERRIVSESTKLGIPVEEYRRIDSAFLFMPQNSTINDYKQVDERAKKMGFEDGYDYLVSEYSAKKKGKTAEDVIAERKLIQQQKEADRAANLKKQEDQYKSSNATAFIPQGQFYTDRGQVSLDVYRAACKKAFASKRTIINELSAAWTHSPEGKLVRNNGESAISNTQIWWDENSQMCYGSYMVSGLADGNSYSLKFSGRVQGFYNSGNGIISGSISRF